MRLATGVAWNYEGDEGVFSYWPDGAEGQAVTIEPPLNMAIVGDSDVMFHRAEAVGGPGGEGAIVPHRFQLHSTAGRVVGDREGGADLREPRPDDIRVSVSSKAQVFADAEEARVFDEHLDDISFEQVVLAWRTDLAGPGVELPDSDVPLHDPAFVSAVTSSYAGTVR